MAMAAGTAAAPGAHMWYKGGIAAPPGLEDVVAPALPQASSPACTNEPSAWTNAVLAASSRLGSCGLRRALAIVDKAARNAQHTKALDELIGDASESPVAKSAAALRAQIAQEQLSLLGELRQLCFGHLAEPAKVAEGMPLATAPQPQFVTPSMAPGVGPPPSVAPARRLAPAASLSPAMCPTTTPSPPALCPKARQVPVQEQMSRDQPQTLTAILQMLSHEDPECLFLVRRISKLGFKAPRRLKKHYSAYGAVVRVLVADSTVRQQFNLECPVKKRPSSLGFIQMASPEAAKAILAEGAKQEVEGVLISVEKFGRPEEPEVQAMNDDQAGEWGNEGFARGTSSGSDHSLASVSTGISEEY